ncbi:MAG TPA: hypothetical protein VFR09_02285, partial [Alphaproteobacteria bacterium]|nr:hypothetical protein [Alphaproteobacteria bacterium]
LQCLRYIPLIRDKAETITLQLTGYLQKLLAGNYPDIKIISLDDPVPNADACAQLTSLPYLCKTRVDTIPPVVPILHATEGKRAVWRERLKAIKGPRIGLVWSGNPQNRVNGNRSIPFDALGPLLSAAGSHLVSLQKNQPDDQAKLAAYGVLDADTYLTDFAETAGLLAELDLLISVCTGPAHLAGVMNRPVWLTLAFESDWRWMEGREDSPWYPGMRLFRQTSPRDWGGVIERVTRDVKAFVGGDAKVLEAKRWQGTPLRQNPNAVPLKESNG